MKYFVSYSHPEKHFIDFKLIINTKDLNILKLQFSAWRPGRYELANFAKNIKDFNITEGITCFGIFKKNKR